MGLRVGIFMLVVTALTAVAGGQDFLESWEAAIVGIYVPGDLVLINGDEGRWFLGDLVSATPACGPTPQRAEILLVDGSKALLLTSNDSESACSDIVWVALAEFDSFNEDFAVPLTPTTIITFDEAGELTAPGLHGTGANCVVPPCFDNVSLLLTDNRDNIVAYVLQRAPDAVENVANINFGVKYREIFLDPEAFSYRRSLFGDFLLIPTFEPAGAQITSIEFRVDEHGSALIDDIFIGPGAPTGTVPVYRFWSPVLGCHFYTIDDAERQSVIDDYPDVLLFEGVAFFAWPGARGGAEPVYRFWSPTLASHFYTISEAERDSVLDLYPDVWTLEGIAFHAFVAGSQPADTEPVYRFWSPVPGCHFYTASEVERDFVLSTYPDVWVSEGIAWYAYAP